MNLLGVDRFEFDSKSTLTSKRVTIQYRLLIEYVGVLISGYSPVQCALRRAMLHGMRAEKSVNKVFIFQKVI